MTDSETYLEPERVTDSEVSELVEFSPAEIQLIEEINTKYRHKMMRVVEYNYQLYNESEKVVQEVFIRLMKFIRDGKKFDEYEDGENAQWPWLNKALRSAALDEIRRSKRHDHFIGSEQQEGAYLDYTDKRNVSGYDVAESNVDMEHVKKRIRSKLNSRSTKWYNIFILNALDGLTDDEIGERLGIPAGTSKSGFFRSRRILADDQELYDILRSEVDAQ